MKKPKPIEIAETTCPSCGNEDNIKAGPIRLDETFQDDFSEEYHSHHTTYFDYHCPECRATWKGKKTPSGIECPLCGYPFREKD